jgi:hypothetical protein
MFASVQVQELCGVPLDQLFADFPSAGQSIIFAAGGPGFKLRDRAVHVYTEAARVLRFRNLAAGDESAEVKVRLAARQCLPLPMPCCCVAVARQRWRRRVPVAPLGRAWRPPAHVAYFVPRPL